MRVLVTGARGFIGAALARAACERGDRVVGVDRSAAGRALPSAVEFIEGDITRPVAWSSVFQGLDAVVHCAALHRPDEVHDGPARSIEVNLQGTRLMLEAAAAAGVGSFVNLSSAKVYGEPLGWPSDEDDLPNPVEPYGLAKAITEDYCSYYRARTGMRCTSVRPFSVYGPEQDLHTGYVGQLLEGWLTDSLVTLSGRPGFLRDFVHVSDVVDLCLAVAAREVTPAVVNIGSGEAAQLEDLVSEFSRLCGVGMAVRWAEPRAGTIARTLAGMTLADQLMGRRPVHWRAGLEDTVSWFLAHRSSVA